MIEERTERHMTQINDMATAYAAAGLVVGAVVVLLLLGGALRGYVYS